MAGPTYKYEKWQLLLINAYKWELLLINGSSYRTLGIISTPRDYKDPSNTSKYPLDKYPLDIKSTPQVQVPINGKAASMS